jgi:hypothetical protein
MRLHNKTILETFIFDINPAYSTNAKHSQDLVSSIKIIEIVPLQRATPFWLYFHYAQMPPI